ncbi:MAG: hypothetical protein F6K48_03170 [Okeania sp. SIO3H1]|nr:hypothetical protein [Okeania sp. SIO3H1]
MFPVNASIKKVNASFMPGLGEILPSVSELMATDPGVSALQAQLGVIRAQLSSLPPTSDHPVPGTCNKAGGKRGDRWNCTATVTVNTASGQASKPRSRSHRFSGTTPASAFSLHNQYKMLKSQESSLNGRLAAAEKRVWDRISKAVPYKAFVIQPIIDRAKNSITYQLKKDGANVGAPHQRLDEAKAVVDEDIAKEQEKTVQSWAEERAVAEGVKPPAQASFAQPQQAAAVPVTATVAPPAVINQLPVQSQGGNWGRILLIGGAAAGALLLLR